MGAGAALAQGSPASPGVRAHRALHCKGIFTCAFFLPSCALFFSLLHVGWGQASGLPFPVRWRAGSSHHSLSSCVELLFTTNALLLAESSSTAILEALSPPYEYLLQPRPLWGAAGLEATVPPLRIGDDVMSSPPELLFAFLQRFPPAVAPASSAFLLPKCLHCFLKFAVFL